MEDLRSPLGVSRLVFLLNNNPAEGKGTSNEGPASTAALARRPFHMVLSILLTPGPARGQLEFRWGLQAACNINVPRAHSLTSGPPRLPGAGTTSQPLSPPFPRVFHGGGGEGGSFQPCLPSLRPRAGQEPAVRKEGHSTPLREQEHPGSDGTFTHTAEATGTQVGITPPRDTPS